MRIFIAHAREDVKDARRIQVLLTKKGHDVFLDTQSLPAGEDHRAAILKEIQACDLFLFLISPDSVAPTRYTLTELKHAEDRWPDPTGRVLPVMLRAVGVDALPPYLEEVVTLQPIGNLAAEVLSAVSGLESRLKGDAAAIPQAPPDATRPRRQFRTVIAIVGSACVAIAVWVTVCPTPRGDSTLVIEPTSIILSDDHPVASVRIRNKGAHDLTFYIADLSQNFVAQPTGGVLPPTQTVTVSVSRNTLPLDKVMRTAFRIKSSTDSVGTEVAITVSTDVRPPTKKPTNPVAPPSGGPPPPPVSDPSATVTTLAPMTRLTVGPIEVVQDGHPTETSWEFTIATDTKKLLLRSREYDQDKEKVVADIPDSTCIDVNVSMAGAVPLEITGERVDKRVDVQKADYEKNYVVRSGTVSLAPFASEAKVNVRAAGGDKRGFFILTIKRTERSQGTCKSEMEPREPKLKRRKAMGKF